MNPQPQKRTPPIHPAAGPRTEADVTDLVRDMGYKPSTTVEEGIGRFVEWYLGVYLDVIIIP